MKKLITLLSLLLLFGSIYATDHITMKIKEIQDPCNVTTLNLDDYISSYYWTEYRDGYDEKNYHKDTDYKIEDDKYCLIDITKGYEDGHSDAMQDYYRLKSKLEKLFPGIECIVRDYNKLTDRNRTVCDYSKRPHHHRHHDDWVAEIKFDKYVEFNGKSCYIETVKVR